MKLAQVNGKPAEVNYPNIDEEIEGHKARLTSEIIKGNPYLQQYLRNNPLAAAVSQNDWGQMDSLSKKFKNFVRNDMETLLKVLEAGEKGFEAFHGTQYPGAGIYGTPKGVFGPMQPGETWIDRAFMSLWAFGPEELMRVLSGDVGIVGGMAGEWLHQAGIADERAPEQIAEALGDPALMAMTEGLTGPMVYTSHVQRAMKLATEKMEARGPVGFKPEELPKVQQTIDKIKPWIRNGEVPPVGVSEVVDEIYKERAKSQSEKLEEAQKEYNGLETPQKLPEYGKEFVRQLDRDNVGIPGEIVQQLYGDKPPTPDDGMLGFVPDLQKKLAFALEHNTDVHVPMADLMEARAKNPEFSQFIKDHIRLDKDGLTRFEAGELKKPEEAKPETLWERPEEEAPKPEGIHPAPPRYSIKEIETHPDDQDLLQKMFGGNNRQFDIMDGDKEVGSGIAHIEGDTLVIDSITAHGPVKEGRFGAQVLRELWQQFAEAHPEINKIAGYRVSGGRVISGQGPTQALATVRRASGLLPSEGRAATPFGEMVVPPEAEQGVKFSPYGIRGESHFSTTLADAISMIDPEQIGPKGSPARILHDFFANRLSRIVGDTPVHVMPEEWHQQMADRFFGGVPNAGGYIRHEHAIYLHPTLITSDAYAGETLMHEGAHALTAAAINGFPEVGNAARAIMRAAEDWFKANDPAAFSDKEIRYAFSNPEGHEFVAQAFSAGEIRDRLGKMPVPPELMSLVKGKNPTMWDVFKAFVKDALSKILGTEVKPTVLHALFELEQRIEEVNKKQFGRGVEQPLGSEGRVPNIGMQNKTRFQKWYDALIKDAQARKDWETEQGLKLAQAQETADYKGRLADVREEVAERLVNRPDLMADEAMRNGTMGGTKIGEPIRIGTDSVTAAQRKGVPDYYFSSRGKDVNVLAEMFDYKTGDQLLQALKGLEDQRRLEDLTPQAHFSKMVDAEADREMRRRYPKSLEDRIIEAAKDHIRGTEVMNLLNEEIHALGMKTEGEMAWNDADVKRQQREALQTQQISDLSSKAFMKAAERNGTIAQDALLEGKIPEALRAKQGQFKNKFVEGVVKKLEKRIASTQDRAKRMGKANINGIAQEDSVYINQFLMNAGVPIERSPTQHAEQMALVGQGVDLRGYVAKVNDTHLVYNQDPNAAPVNNILEIPDALLDPPPPGKNRLGIDNMTVEEFNAFANSLEAMEKYGRRANKVTVRGKQRELREHADGMIGQLKATVNNEPVGDGKHLLQLLGSWMLTPETWFKRIDLFNQKGVYQQTLLRPITEGMYEGRNLEKDFAKDWNELGPYKDHHVPINNPLFRDEDGDLLRMTVGNARGVLANMGNALQRKKLLLGWGVAKDESELAAAEQMVWQWLAAPREAGGAGLTVDDLATSQKRGKIYEKAFDISRVKYAERGGVPADKIDLGNVQTPWGTAGEWYHPLIPDSLRNGRAKIDPSELVSEGGGYYRPRPSHGYTQKRTGAIYRVDLSLDSSGWKLKQILNDAVMQGPVEDVGKIIYDKKFANAFRKYYGEYYYSALDKWLHDVAGNRPWMPSNDSRIMQGLVEGGRNLNNLAVGMNIMGTLPKHFFSALGQSIDEVGAAGILKYMYKLARVDTDEAKQLYTYSQENSGEIPSRMRVMSETITGVDATMFKKPGPGGLNWSTFRNGMETIGHYPVAHSDLLISRAMWLADVERMAKEHPEWQEGDLFDHADAAVRRTHGSTIIANRPQYLRFHPLMNALSPLQNFTATFLQRNYEAWVMGKIMMQGGRTLPEMKGFAEETFKSSPQGWGKVVGRGFWSGLAIAGVEEAVRRYLAGGAPPPEKESTSAYWAKSIAHPYAAMLPGPLRDVATAVLDNREPLIGGLFGGIGRDVKTLYDDATSWKLIQRNPGKFVRSAERVFGLFGGGMWDHFVGTGAEYLTNVMAGVERPKGLKDWGEGIYYGTNKPAKPH